MNLRPLIVAAFVVTLLLASPACSDSDPSAIETAANGDASIDAEQVIPTVDPNDFEAAQPAPPPRRIHAESSTQRGVISDTPHLQAQLFFPSQQAAQLIDGLSPSDLEIFPLPGQTASTTYNAIRFAPATDDPSDFGVSLQVWDLSDASSTTDERLQQWRDQFLNVDDPALDGEALPGAFTSQRSNIRSLVFAGQTTPHLFILSCDTQYCHDFDALIDLAQDIATDH